MSERDLSLVGTSTVYMDGTGVYNLRQVDRPGVLATLVLRFDVAKDLAAQLERGRRG